MAAGGLAVLVVAALLVYAYVVRSVTRVDPVQEAASNVFWLVLVLENLETGDIECARTLVASSLRTETIALEMLLEDRAADPAVESRARRVLDRVESVRTTVESEDLGRCGGFAQAAE
jgi:hypothetical protein